MQLNRALFIFASTTLLISGCEAWGRDPRVARAGDIVIRGSDYRKWLDKALNSTYSNSLSPDDRRRYLDTLLQQRMALELAHESGLEQDTAYKVRVDTLSSFLSKQSAASHDPKYPDHVKDLMESVLLMSYRSQIPVSDDEMRTYYREHTAMYKAIPGSGGHPSRIFDQVKSEIKNQLQAEKFAGMCAQKLSSLQPDINEKALDSLDLSQSSTH